VISLTEIWNPGLVLGDPLIDEQHQALVAMIVELDQRMSDSSYSQGAIDAVQGMMAYAATHFEDEEALMAESGWPDLERHRTLHAEFMTRTNDFSKDARVDGEWASLDMLRYLVSWLLTHINEEDREFLTWLRRTREPDGSTTA